MNLTLLHRFAVTAFGTAMVTGNLDAQSRQVPAARQDRPIAIINAVLHNPPPEIDGTEEILVENAFVLFDEGRILMTGSGDPGNLDGYDVLNAEGLHLYPGLITGPSQLGLVETLQVRATDDRSELDNMHPEVTTWIAVNPDSDLIPVARSAGILTALVFPSGGLLGGQPSAIRLDGWTTEDLVLERSIGTTIRWPLVYPIEMSFFRRSRGDQTNRSAEQIKEIDTFFDDAEAWHAARAADETVPFNARFASVGTILSGERPVFIDASRASQIEAAVAWSKRRGYKAVIVGGTAAPECATLLAEQGIPVIYRGTHRLPLARHASHDEVFKAPERLRKAGILFSIGNADSEPAHERSLAHQAATAAAYGLPPGAALRSVTLSPAEIAGIDADLGSIEPGKAATILITTGNPLEITSETLVAFIDGRRIDLSDRQKQLVVKYREKYRQLGIE
jgi:hypothetical protein